MANHGISDKGFKTKRLTEVQEGMRQRAANIFADLVPPNEVVDTSASSLLGRLITLSSVSNADLWELSHQIYLAFDPNSATGISLDNIVALGGIRREPESRTTADIYLYGDAGITIPFGSVVWSNTTSVSYTLNQTVDLRKESAHGVGITFPNIQPETKYSIFYSLAGGTAFTEISITTGPAASLEGMYEDLKNKIENEHPQLISYVEDDIFFIESAIEFQLLSFYTSLNVALNKVVGMGRVEADEAGEVIQAPNTINGIATPVLGWDRVTNPTQASTGRDRETDEQLRERFRQTKFQRATNIIESLYSALYDVSGVTSIIIYENDTDVEDERGIPPHSFWVIVDGGIEVDVAKAIWLNRPAGIRSVGNTQVSIIDSYGYTRDIKFGRPVQVPFYVRLNIETFQDFPPDGVAQIKANLVEYVNSLVVNEDVTYSRLYTPINKVAGHQVNLLEVSTDGVDWKTANIEVGLDERATLIEDNITIL